MIWNIYATFEVWYHGQFHRFFLIDNIEAMTREDAIKLAYDVLMIDAKLFFNTKVITYGEYSTEYCYPIEKVDY